MPAPTTQHVAEQILDGVGGAANVTAVENCITRLRFVLKDKSKASKAALEAVDGVQGVVFQSGQCQVVMGVQAAAVHKVLMKEGIADLDHDAPDAPEAPEAGADGPAPRRRIFDRVMDVLAGSISPIIPIIIAAGLIQVLAALLLITGAVSAENEVYILLTAVGTAGFYFLPIFLGYSAARAMRTNPAIGMLLGAVLVYPDLATRISGEDGLHLFGLQIPAVSYTSTVIPILLVVWAMSWVDKGLLRVIPKAVSSLVVPLLLTLIMVPIALFVAGPIGSAFGSLVAGALSGLFDSGFGWLAVVLLATLFPVLVMFGAHWAIVPIYLEFFNTLGYDPLLLTAGFAYNMAAAGVALAVAIKSKNAELKSTGFAAAFSGFMGITEPALYGIGLRLRRPMIGIFAGAFAGGLVAGIAAIKVYVVAPLQGVLALPSYADGGLGIVWAAVTIVVAAAVGFVVAWVVGFQDTVKRVEA